MEINYYDALLTVNTNEKIFNICNNYCKSILTPDRCRVYLFDDTMDYLICRYRYGNIFYSEGDDKISSKQSKSIIVRTALENTPQIINNIFKDERADEKVLIKFGIYAILSIPLEWLGLAQGVISFDFKDEMKFTPKNITRMVNFVKHACKIIENRELAKKVNSMDKKFKEQLEKKSFEYDKMNEQLLLTGRLSALGQLASGVAHEIKNPLAVIKMLISTIDSEMKKDSKFKDDISVLKTEIIRLEDIVNHFLNFARPKKVERVETNLNELLLDVYDFLKIKFKEHNIELNMDLYLPLKNIFIDRNQMKQVFINIFLNCIEACSKTENAYIDIRTYLITRKKGTFIVLEISDNGPGIKEEIISQIFDPFTTSRSDGLGLGLSISYRIIIDHNGKITAKNKLSGGAKFEIILPADNISQKDTEN